MHAWITRASACAGVGFGMRVAGSMPGACRNSQAANPMAKKRPVAQAASPAPKKRPGSSRAAAPAANKGRAAQRAKQAHHDISDPDFVGHVLDKVEKAGYMDILHANIGALKVLEVGSACSGSNVTSFMLHKLMQKLGIGSVKEIFQCEKMPSKQEWGMWLAKELENNPDDPPHMFTDINDLCCRDGAVCMAHNPSYKCLVPTRVRGGRGPLLVHIAFSCKNFSKLYNMSAGARGVIVVSMKTCKVGKPVWAL